MSDDLDRPLLRFRRRPPGALKPSGRPRSEKVSKEEQSRRLGPRFEELERAIEARRITLQREGADAFPEHVVVFELDRANLRRLSDAIKDGPIEWLLNEEFDPQEQDEDDDSIADDEDTSDARAYVCLMFTSQEAVQDLLRAWRAWQIGSLPERLGFWKEVFDTLLNVRRWGREDRVRESGLEALWREIVAEGRTEPFEIELWCRRRTEDRDDAERRVRRQVEELGGQVLDRATISSIAWHALLVSASATVIERLLNDPNVALVQNDDIQRFRPMSGPGELRTGDDEPALVPPRGYPPSAEALEAPLVALLDGLPMQNHLALAGRLDVYDPDELEPRYLVSNRRHGTAMASLITRGDLDANDSPSTRRLFVRPVMEPSDNGRERAPKTRLWLDLIRRAVHESLAKSHDVRIFNLSLGDETAPFLRGLSPFARLLDWLAWEYRVLFIVSAGNCSDGFECNPLDPTREVLRALWRTRMRRRVLSPAEGVQVLTVGAVPWDSSAPNDPRRNPSCQSLVDGEDLPAPYSRNGPGFRRTVKPDILMPGGRQKYSRNALERGPFVPVNDVRPPGQCVASPRGIDARTYNAGTSNATALASRAAERVLSRIHVLSQQFPVEHEVPVHCEALLTRTFLIHSARWVDNGSRLRRELEGEDGANGARLSHLLGFGLVDVERVLNCTEQRVTLYDVGEIRPKEAWQYELPLPDCIQNSVALRRVVITVSWFTPIHPRDRRYRCVAIGVSSNVEASSLRVKPQGASNQHCGGTVYHRVFERAGGAIDLSDESSVAITLRAYAQAPYDDPQLEVPYVIAVTFETEDRLPVYDEVRTAIRARSVIR